MKLIHRLGIHHFHPMSRHGLGDRWTLWVCICGKVRAVDDIKEPEVTA